MSIYRVERQCSCVFTEKKGCPSCANTGWKDLKTESDRKRAVKIKNYYIKYFSNVKVRIKRID